MEDLKPSVGAYLLQHDLEFTPDGRFVRFKPDNKTHPRNWSLTRKSYDIGMIFMLDLFVTASSTAGSSAAAEAESEFNIGPTLSIFCFVTLFLLGQVIGSILLAPWSEAFGRKKLYIASSGIISICCVIVGVAPSIAAVVVGRFIAGLLSAIPCNVGVGSVEDLFRSKERIWVVFIWMIASNIGLIIGPIMSSYIIASLDWRWVLYIYAIIIAFVGLFMVFIRESRPSVILTRQVNHVRKETGIDTLRALNHDHTPDLRTYCRVSLLRPLQLFFTEPVVFVVALMIAVAFALLYLFTEALQPIYQDLGFSHKEASLAFLAILVGIGFSALTRMLDHHIANLVRRKGRAVRPEDKLAGLAIGAPIFAIGLWWFAWTIPPDVHGVPWIVPTIALAFIGYALCEFDTVLQGYLSDSYLSYSASAGAAVQFLRALLSGIFPLFTQQMFNGLGANVATSILAIVATLFCAAPPLFICYGERIRSRSKFANYSLAIQAEMGKGVEDF
ncbi:hypothetical protein ASPWEDRAFT_60982 [Aspergillus wentii DTO 134E9]|uniref:Major facilitator superfamily (MFS) profile domain-containing protein n=1 Tax=Aspergillus wentii DTO 134E9 TaxID=1073089 RepID=A0A1L9RCP8_ASPWE|nr:uncharacterized protein ASPWEDRAFT_60982 [Aspergillus wentii DTO 134E9]OJJ32668.1 hypothetical protein ASPWEDRAFT_60982 [Aspergillus wentii DTO 134E9]